MTVSMVVGLTGGIASGKSTVGRLFRSLGVPVVDADEAARRVVEPGSPGLAAIRESFSDAVLDADGRLDRARLRAAVFHHPERRRELEAILHPLIRAWMDRRMGELEGPYAIRMVPLLVETGQYRDMDRVLVVDLPTEMQIQRALSRDGGDAATIEGIITAQASREERLQVADDVIDNSGDPGSLEPQVRALHHRYLELAVRLRDVQRK